MTQPNNNTNPNQDKDKTNPVPGHDDNKDASKDKKVPAGTPQHQ